MKYISINYLQILTLNIFFISVYHKITIHGEIIDQESQETTLHRVETSLNNRERETLQNGFIFVPNDVKIPQNEFGPTQNGVNAIQNGVNVMHNGFGNSQNGGSATQTSRDITQIGASPTQNGRDSTQNGVNSGQNLVNHVNQQPNIIHVTIEDANSPNSAKEKVKFVTIHEQIPVPVKIIQPVVKHVAVPVVPKKSSPKPFQKVVSTRKELPRKTTPRKVVPKPVKVIQRVPVPIDRFVAIPIEKKVAVPVLIPAQSGKLNKFANKTTNHTSKFQSMDELFTLIDRKYRNLEDSEDYIKQFRFSGNSGGLQNYRTKKGPKSSKNKGKVITLKPAKSMKSVRPGGKYYEPVRSVGKFYDDSELIGMLNERPLVHSKRKPRISDFKDYKDLKEIMNPKYQYKCDVRYKGPKVHEYGEDQELDFQEAMHSLNKHEPFQNMKHPMEMSHYIDEAIHHHIMKAFGVDTYAKEKFRSLPNEYGSLGNSENLGGNLGGLGSNSGHLRGIGGLENLVDLGSSGGLGDLGLSQSQFDGFSHQGKYKSAQVQDERFNDGRFQGNAEGFSNFDHLSGNSGNLHKSQVNNFNHHSKGNIYSKSHNRDVHHPRGTGYFKSADKPVVNTNSPLIQQANNFNNAQEQLSFTQPPGGVYAKKEPIIYKGEAYNNFNGNGDYSLASLEQMTPPKRLNF